MKLFGVGETLILTVVGFVLVMVGALLPFLMVQHILRSTLLLNFFAFAISVSGLFLGVTGVANYVSRNRIKREK
jgi:hypothetical protein